MTAPETHPDSPLYARVQRRIPSMAKRMLETFQREIPLYRLLPREQLEGEVFEICQANLRVFFACLREARPPTDSELAEPSASAARRAEERVPLAAVLEAYHVGGRIGWQTLAEHAKPDEADALLRAVDTIQSYVQAVTSAVASAYLEEQQSIYGEERDTRRALAQALLSGAPADALAARLGVRLPAAYLVIALSLGAHTDEQEPGVAGSVAGRRKLRRVQAALDEYAGEAVLTLLDGAGGEVLLPSASGGDDLDAEVEALPKLIDAIAAAAGVEVTAGAACCGSDGLPGTARQARDVLALVRKLGRPPGLYLLDDVLLEYQLTRPSDALPALAGLLTPLDRNPDLLLTLETYVEHDLDRRRTAAALHVHPNTLDYRLRRIVELTRLEPSTARGLQLLAAALAARRLQAG